jgi:hypothetical protein
MGGGSSVIGADRVLMRRFLALGDAPHANDHQMRFYMLDQQVWRWLLLSLDRLNSNLIMTQELIANMLGVHREGVTEAAGNQQKAGLIDYRHRHSNQDRSQSPVAALWEVTSNISHPPLKRMMDARQVR